MIREFKSADLDKVMEIWLQGNEQAHNFIDSNFFKQNFDIVEMLIRSEERRVGKECR